MSLSFDEALNIAQKKYPHIINRYEEYQNYFVFDYDDGEVHYGGTMSPIVIRKSDGEPFNYAPIFFDMGENAEDVGDVISEGKI